MTASPVLPALTGLATEDALGDRRGDVVDVALEPRAGVGGIRLESRAGVGQRGAGLRAGAPDQRRALVVGGAPRRFHLLRYFLARGAGARVELRGGLAGALLGLRG